MKRVVILYSRTSRLWISNKFILFPFKLKASTYRKRLIRHSEEAYPSSNRFSSPSECWLSLGSDTSLTGGPWPGSAPCLGVSSSSWSFFFRKVPIGWWRMIGRKKQSDFSLKHFIIVYIESQPFHLMLVLRNQINEVPLIHTMLQIKKLYCCYLAFYRVICIIPELPNFIKNIKQKQKK